MYGSFGYWFADFSFAPFVLFLWLIAFLLFDLPPDYCLLLCSPTQKLYFQIVCLNRWLPFFVLAKRVGLLFVLIRESGFRVVVLFPLCFVAHRIRLALEMCKYF